MSKYFGRRNLLRTAGISVAGSAAMSMSGVASPNTTLDDRVKSSDSVASVHDVSRIGFSESGAVLMVVTLKETDKKTKEVRYQDYGVGIAEDTGSVEATQLSSEKAERLQQGNDDQVTIQDDHWPEAPEVVKEVHHLTQREIGECAAFDHRHEKEGVSLKFTFDIGKVGVGTALGVLTGYVAYAATGGLLAAANGAAGGALSTDLLDRYVSTNALSLVAHEYDVSKWGWNQTMCGLDMRGQWKQYDPNYMFTFFTAPSHPSCGNCGFGINTDGT